MKTEDIDDIVLRNYIMATPDDNTKYKLKKSDKIVDVVFFEHVNPKLIILYMRYEPNKRTTVYRAMSKYVNVDSTQFYNEYNTKMIPYNLKLIRKDKIDKINQQTSKYNI